MKFNNEIDELISKMTGEKILRHTCQLLVKDGAGLKPHGSGVFVIISDVYFLLTASHVTRDWSNQNQLYIRIGVKEYIPLVGELRETDLEKDENIDLAYVRIDESIVPYLIKPYIFLPISKIRDHKRLINATNYCVMGYPEKSNAHIDGKMEPVAQAYYVSPSSKKVYDHYKFNQDIFFMLEMKGKGINIKTGEKKKTGTHFYGISGCGLWLMLIDPEKNGVDYRLIGIMTEFRNSKYLTLIGIKIKLVLDGIRKLEKISLLEKRA